MNVGKATFFKPLTYLVIEKGLDNQTFNLLKSYSSEVQKSKTLRLPWEEYATSHF